MKIKDFDDFIDRLIDHFCQCKDNIEVQPNDERCESCKFIESLTNQYNEDVLE